MFERHSSKKPKLLQIMDKGSDKVSIAFLYVASLSLAIAILALAYSSVMRYVFRAPWDWSIDLPMYVQAAIIALALANAQRLRAHIRVDFIITRLHGWAGQIAQLLGLLAMAFFCGTIAWGILREAIASLKIWEVAPDTGIPYGVVLLVIFIGVSLLCLETLLEIVLSFTTKSSGEVSH
ncbi:TRAP transporter small permease [Chloroflexota bacterium]